MPIVKKIAKDTLTAVELDRGETLHFTLANGSLWTMEILETSAEVFRTTLKELKVAERLARTDFRFRADVKINGQPHTFERECSTPKSFYEPWVVDGVTIIGETNLSARVAADASALYARNVLDFLKLVLPKDATAVQVPMDDDIVVACLMTQAGEVKRT